MEDRNSLSKQPETIVITQATVADAMLLSDIGGRSLIESHGHSAPAAVMQAYKAEKFSVAALANELADPGNRFHILFYEGQAAGYSKVIYRQPLPGVPEQALTKLERLYLLSEYYDRKLGQHLLQFAIAQSKAQGEAGMWLYVWNGNERAIRFYEKAGFHTVGEGDFRLTETHANKAWRMLLRY